jgi:long-chain fatty acid transport protein
MANLDFRRAAALAVCAGTTLPTIAFGSSFALLEQSASRLGTAFAGTAAAADDATTIYFNPAGLSRLESAELIALASAIEITSTFENSASTPAFGQPLGNDGGDAGDWNFVPGAYFAFPVSEKLALGIAVNAPFGLKLVYDDGWLGRFQAAKSEIKTLNVNPSLAWRVNDRFSIGVGVSYQRIDAELTNSVNYSAVVAQGVQQLVAAGQLPPAAAPGVIAANAGLGGGTRVEGDDTGWGYNVGLLFDLTPTTTIGLAYRSAIDYDVEGTLDFTAPTTTNPIGAGIIAAASAGALADGPISVALKVPDSATLSLQQRLGDRFALYADVAWTGWSTVPELRIVRDGGTTASVTPERWSDSWRYALGGSWNVGEAFALRAGVAYDNTPVPDATRTPRLPDPNRTWTTVGLQWRVSSAAIFDVAYAHLFSDSVPLSQNAGNAAAFGTIVGDQESDIDIVSAQFVWRFQ